MSDTRIDDLNLVSGRLLVTPDELMARLAVPESGVAQVVRGRGQIQAILERRDPRLIVVVGPCSIHDLGCAREYAGRLRALAQEVSDALLIVMRVYFEKPRTTVGWKGFITDPRLDDSFQIDEGLQRARELLIQLAELGLPAATEFVDPFIPQYIGDLISWSAIGARTSESQKHREMASGLSSPVGIKNGTDGSIETAIHGLVAVSTSHQFLGVDKEGRPSVFVTRGNRHAHIVLRGGPSPNYDSARVRLCEEALRRSGLVENVMIDCSHGNSSGDYERQPAVFEDCVHQILEGNRSIVGFMLESNLRAGRQPIPADLSLLEPGVSITDGCIDWDTTSALLESACESLREVLPTRAAGPDALPGEERRDG